MSDLIKRIDDALNRGISELSPELGSILSDCRAEIELLTQSNQSLRDQNTALDEKLAKYSEHTYTPMTEDEFRKLVVDWHDKGGNFAWPQYIEQAVVKRFLNPGDNNDS